MHFADWKLITMTHSMVSGKWKKEESEHGAMDEVFFFSMPLITITYQ